MGTIQKSTALKIVKNKGKYKTDPVAFCVLRYISPWDGLMYYAICYSEDEYIGYADFMHTVLFPKQETQK